MGIHLAAEKAGSRNIKTVCAIMVLAGSEQVVDEPGWERPAIQRIWPLANNPIGLS